ncbi:methyl-accepting chemotaxis protein [Ancylobacter lacus]|uniref:methyl-accepting chemotaxis protein n=1 Tax=Ancylobacter lacus TaxID=2579970 RepID=UPI001BCBB19C|nr:methyl-accepting chemotaxis protein [Ancylobacter lacus]MBS7540013.1 PAS domain-containing protein [Ancylobacter lacus]
MSSASIHALRRPQPLGFDTALLDNLPSAVLLCDPTTGLVRYANARALSLFSDIRRALSATAEGLVGASLALFGLDIGPAGDRLSRPGVLPLHQTVEVGGEVLTFDIVPLRDGRGRLSHLQVVWSVDTEAVTAQNKYRRLLQMVEQMPINVMTCRLDGFTIDYANKTSLDTLRRIEQYLPIKASELIGSSIDVFHKKPEMQRAMLADASRLPHTARIKVGPETLNLSVSALTRPDGSYDGPMLTWALVTDSVRVADSVNGVIEGMARTSTAMENASQQLTSLTAQSEHMSASVSAAAVQMSGSFNEVSQQIHRANSMTSQAADQAASANGLVGGLVQSVERIGNVSALIERIASQTNLLALNAAIEAARVGEAGKGFAVVASEVKALALQTANATKDISNQVDAVQRASGAAAQAVSEITGNVRTLRDVFVALSSAVEEQASTNESVSRSIEGVSSASSRIRGSATEIAGVSREIVGFAERLRSEVKVLIAQ